MQLKTYQQNTLNVLTEFFQSIRFIGVAEAFKKMTCEPEISFRLGNLKSDYVVWEAVPNTPRVCLKIPTGGGKTILAAYSIKIVSDIWLEREFSVVLWFTPSDTIRRQTAEALKNPRHPYRETLDEQFQGQIRIFDIDEKFNIRPADIANNTCVIVSTIQAFRQSKTGKYNVYKHNENLEPHFSHIAPDDKMEFDEKGELKYSFANLLYYHRPIVIVDEAHNVISSLSQEMQRRINPSAIIEWTATPQSKNNTLYNVRATELKEEEMIKLPIELREHVGWEQAVDEAIVKRTELEKAAEQERDYIRPILLFQAQDKNGEVNVDVLKNYLLETANIPEKEIAIATGEQKELDGIDVFSRTCPIKYIITVEALKEGWDCPFAYVLCSLANVKSNTAVEQLLGRVMRMPYARLRKITSLNKAYAYVLSSQFGEAAETLVNKLIQKGFDNGEAESAIETVPQQEELFEQLDIQKVRLSTPLTQFTLPKSIKLDPKDSTIIEFTPSTTDADVEKICEQVTEKEAFEIQKSYSYYRKREETPSPAKQGAKFVVPCFMMEFQGKFVFADPETIFENYDWDIAKIISPRLESNEFNIEPQGNGFVIDIDERRLRYSVAGEEQILMPFVDVENWTVNHLVFWLDRKLKQEDIPQISMLDWLRKIVEYLNQKRKINLPKLMIAKYVLADKIKNKIDAARMTAKKQAFQTTFFERKGCVKLDFDNGFKFREGMYDGVLFQQRSKYKFTKHFLGPAKVPQIDGGESGEEFQCAKAIDSLPEVKYWLRNVPQHKNSFWLPTSTDKFYPDFVVKLEDERTLIVEYKGAHLVNNDDTKEKNMIGELWEKQSNNKGLFLIAENSKNGMNVSTQIKTKIIKL
ncbi:MAG: DEAD/DEAH box helicase family protein [Planctomycetaceae bacterium]|jgi:type III restriction enzyme|nr:DEAD/DEAH box helicase family protein [Planctomycetaceae bacterium]